MRTGPLAESAAEEPVLSGSADKIILGKCGVNMKKTTKAAVSWIAGSGIQTVGVPLDGKLEPAC